MDRLRCIGHRWNHTRLGQVYCHLRLNLPRRTTKRLPVRRVHAMDVIAPPHVAWAIDVDTALPAERVIRGLAQVTAWRGQPQAMRLDNGPEFLADRVAPRCADRGLALRDIQPGQPNPPAVVERFNRTFRHEVRDADVFESLGQVREISEEWRRDYTAERPHDPLDGMPPTVFRAHQTVGSSPLILSP